MPALGDVELVQTLVDAGFNDDGTDKLRNALAVVFAESGAHCDAKHVNSPTSIDRGLFQINSHWHPEVSDECAYRCGCNAEAAFKISKQGTNWKPWATWPAAAQGHYPDADRALKAWRER